MLAVDPRDERAPAGRWKPAFLLVATAVLAGLGWLLKPQIEAAVYLSKLLAADAPAQLPIPVAGITAVQLRDSFGAPRSGGRRHQGIDIFAPRGRTVRSTTDGIVLHIGENHLGGLVVSVLGPGGQRHYYAHLDTQAPLTAGQRIRAGTPIGTVGTTGNARGTPPHLHYGVYGAGGALNPYPLLRTPPARTVPASTRPTAVAPTGG